MESAFRVTQVGHRVQGDVGNRLAEGDVETDELLHGVRFQTDRRREGRRGRTAKRVGYNDPYTALSPSVTVRGVACSIT